MLVRLHQKKLSILPGSERQREQSKDKGESERFIQLKKSCPLPSKTQAPLFQRKSSENITPHHLPQPHHAIISASFGSTGSRIYIISHTNMMPKFHSPSTPISIHRIATNAAIITWSHNPLLLFLPFTYTCQGIKRHRPGRGWDTRTFQPPSGTRGARRIHHFPWFLH